MSKYQKKSKTVRRQRPKRPASSGGGSMQGITTGAMGGMVHGFRRAIGVEHSRPTAAARVLLLLVLGGLGALLAWQLSR